MCHAPGVSGRPSVDCTFIFPNLRGMDASTHLFGGIVKFDVDSPAVSTLEQSGTEDRGDVPDLSYGDTGMSMLPDMTLLDSGTSYHLTSSLPGITDNGIIVATEPLKPVSQAPNAHPSTSPGHSATSLQKSGHSSATSYPPSEAKPPDRRRGRKAKRRGAPVVQEAKRSKVLEKHRLAASKSRQKKKEYVAELEKTKVGLERQNANIHLTYRRLLVEITNIKNQLLVHANCSDPNIDQWLDSESRKFVQGTKESMIHSHFRHLSVIARSERNLNSLPNLSFNNVAVIKGEKEDDNIIKYDHM